VTGRAIETFANNAVLETRNVRVDGLEFWRAVPHERRLAHAYWEPQKYEDFSSFSRVTIYV